MNFMNHAFLRPEETLGDQYSECSAHVFLCLVDGDGLWGHVCTD